MKQRAKKRKLVFKRTSHYSAKVPKEKPRHPLDFGDMTWRPELVEHAFSGISKAGWLGVVSK